ncbi:MAG TPA: hypothetical protein PKH08_00990 [Clostridia bacterium]|nr:hypothetical protein [Clostridia bacterium]
MKRYKKHLIVILALVLCLSMLLAACIKETPPPTKKEGPDILPDLKDLSLAIADYAPAAKTYPAALKQEKANKLKAKQDEEKKKHHYAYENGEWTTNFDYDKGEYKWEEDTATFTKIFLFADVNELIDRMGIAALSEEKMSALVDYITRTDPASDDYIMTPGTGSAIRDYEELEELYDLYDDDDSDDNYKALQKKRRKVMHEVVNIFGDDAAAAARTAVEVLAYSQKVVATKMIPDLVEKKGLSSPPSFDDFFKDELFDYDTLVYFRAFNETCGATSTGKYLLSSVNADYLIPADNKKEIVKLYGYYYQYEKKDFEVFDDAKYDRYLELSLKDYYDTEAEALEYRDYDRDRYVKAYRYSAEFYKKFYEAHFKFQFKQENHDLKVYGIENKKGEWNNKSYALEMQTGCDIGMAATLKLSDVNWIYTGKNANVINYNAAAKEYYSLPQFKRDNEFNEANIALVHLRIEQLKSQLFTLRKSDMVNGTDFSNALIYQIYSFSGDYVRTMIANRKNDVYMRAEIERLKKKKRAEAPQQEIQEIDEKIDEKQKEIDRNDAMYENHKYFYVQNGKIEEQLRTAKNHDWNDIAEGIETTIAYDYDNYHNLYVRDAGIVVIDGVTYNDKVHIRFEDTLIKKKIVQQGDSTRDAKKEYDTDWAISRLLDNHENVFRYAYGQIKVEYLRYNNSELNNIILKGDNVSEVKPDPKLEDPNSTALENPLIYAVSMSKREEFDALPSTVVVDTDENYKTDEGIKLAIYEGSQWKGILPSNGNVDDCPGIYFINEKEEGNIKYTYHLIFEGWYLDKNLKVPAKLVDGRFGEEFDYDIRLYPSYIVIKYQK